jgi:dihydrofolate synthase/folylpolyglutamate synthase
MAFDYVARAGADVALIETGLGGRLDSTNVVMPVVAGVTSIGFDHTEYLGNTLEEIAAEKAGIFKPGSAAVIGETDPHVRALLAEHARRAGASSVRLASDEIRFEGIDVSDAGTTCRIVWNGKSAVLTTPLAGMHQASNLAFSLVMLDAAGPPFRVVLDEAADNLRRVRIPGRFQHVGRFVFDVAHNPAGSEVLVETLLAVNPPRPVTALLCVLGDKDWREMIRVLSRVVSRFVLTMAPTAPVSRAWNLADAAAFGRDLGVELEVVADFDEALAIVRRAEGTIVVTGSFHTVGDAMERLEVSPLAQPG